MGRTKPRAGHLNKNNYLPIIVTIKIKFYDKSLLGSVPNIIGSWAVFVQNRFSYAKTYH